MTVSSSGRSGLTRRTALKGAAALAGASAGLAAPHVAAQGGLSGEIAFATFEWNLPHTGSVLRALSESFSKKYPNVRVREIAMPAPGFHDQMLTQLMAGTPPDIFRIDDPQIAVYMERGFLTPLDAALRDAGIDTSKLAPANRDAASGGVQQAIVYQTNARQLIYNSALLKAGGFDAPPRDAAQFESAIMKSTQKDKGIFGYTIGSKAGDASGMFSLLAPVIVGFGASFTTDDGKPSATDPRMIEALSFLKRIWDADAVPRGLDGPAANKLVFDGRVAMTINGSFVFGAAIPEVKPHLGAVASPLPGKRLVRSSSWYGVAAKGKNRDAAVAWLMHMLTPESQAKIVEVERVTPAIPSLVPAAILEREPWFKTFVDGAASAVSYLPPGLGSKSFSQIKTITDAIEQILYRSRPVAETMAELQKTLEANLKT